MKPLIILIVLFIAVLLFFVVRSRLKRTELPDSDTKRPMHMALTKPAKTNDKLVIVKGITEVDLKKVLIGFCNTYNKESIQAQLQLIKLTEREFAITFPFDIDFEIFCYLINYIEYPMEAIWSPDVTAWCTTKLGDMWISEKNANKKVMLFIPTDDTEHDNVYLTTQDNIGFKLGFAMGEENKQLDIPKKRYAQPYLQISDLNSKEFEDIN